MLEIIEQMMFALAVGLAFYVIARMDKPMPIEVLELKDKPWPFVLCPHCGEIFYPHLRGQVQRRRHRWLFWGKQPHCCLICSECHEVVGYEEPEGEHECVS